MVTSISAGSVEIGATYANATGLLLFTAEPPVGYSEGRHDVDVERGPRLTGNRAGDRPAYGVDDPERVERARHRERNRDRIDRTGHGRSVAAISG
jgi:hypothetical protein